MSDAKEPVLAELAEYEAKLTGIENRFKHTREAIWIGDGDAQHLLQCVLEMTDLLGSVLGKPNQYARQISAYYSHGLQNMHGSPSLQSVRDIISVVKAVQTHIRRPSTVFVQSRDRKIQAGANVFIGHGRSKEWLALKEFIVERMRLPVDEFNQVPVAGMATKERLSTMLAAAIAFLVLTAEDETADGELQARMNVVHEVGLFQGRLGFSKAIVMLEEGCREFSNIEGLGQIRFPKNNIKAKFHEVELVLEREGLKKAPDR
jgi:predicted nucleotide-binding protein